MLRPAAAPLLALLYARVDARTDKRLSQQLGLPGGGSAVTDEHLRLLLDAMSEQNAALHARFGGTSRR